MRCTCGRARISIASGSKAKKARRWVVLALKGFACVARHLIIAHRHGSIEAYRAQLATLLGPEEATEITMTIYLKVLEGELA